MNISLNTSSDCIFTSDAQCTALISIRRAIGILSVLGCGSIIFLIFLLKRYVLLVQRLILYLVTSALFDAIGYIIGGNLLESGPICVIQGFWLQFFDFMVIVWVCNITVNLIWNVMFQRTSGKYFEIFYIFASIAVPLTFALPAFINNSYGKAGLWCWIENSDLGSIFRYLLWYAPSFLIIIMLFVAYIVVFVRVFYYIRSHDPTNPYSTAQKELLKKEIYPLLRYPFIFLILSVFPLVNRVQNTIAPSTPVFILSLLQAFSSPMLGFCYALAFALDKNTLRELKPATLRMHFKSWFKNNQPKVFEANPTTEMPASEYAVFSDKHNLLSPKPSRPI